MSQSKTTTKNTTKNTTKTHKNTIQTDPKQYLRILTTPAIQDPNELQTILTTSLRSLYGTCHPHHFVQVLVCFPPPTNTNTNTNTKNTQQWNEAIVSSPSSSIHALRAALTFLTLPDHYWKDATLYRVDVLEVCDCLDIQELEGSKGVQFGRVVVP